MFVIKRSKSRFVAYKQEAIAILLLLGIVLLTLSLYTYNPHDPSWFYYTSHHAPYANVCGALGAHIASLLFYLFGFAAFLLIPYGIFISFLLISRRTWHEEWERVIAGAVGIGGVATLCYVHEFQLPSSMLPGGMVGYVFGATMHSLFDHVGA